jgi:hypothetical protein
MTTPNLLPSLLNNEELIVDLCRFSESVLTKQQVRRKWKLEDEVWEALGTDEVYVAQVELERVRRIRSGAAKRELAQLHLVKAPAVLDSILSDPKANARHRIDSAKALNDLADFTPQVARDVDRVRITIDLGGDVRAKGGASNPSDVLVVEAEVPPKLADADWKGIGAPREPLPMIEASERVEQEVVPLKRKPGRPRGSKTVNRKPKVVEPEAKPRCVPGFNLD